MSIENERDMKSDVSHAESQRKDQMHAQNGSWDHVKNEISKMSHHRGTENTEK